MESAQDLQHQELVAPPGWQKKISVTKKGKKDAYFVAPDGEEVKSRQHLTRYLKSHPGGPSAHDFDWSTGETATRRSSRISVKTPAALAAASAEPPKKRARRSKVEKNEEKKEATEEETITATEEEKQNMEETPAAIIDAKKDEDVPVAQVTENEGKKLEDAEGAAKADEEMEDGCKKEETNVYEEAKEKEKEKEKTVDVDVNAVAETAKEDETSVAPEAKTLDVGSCMLSKEDEAKGTTEQFSEKSGPCSPMCPDTTKLSMPLGIST